MHESIEVDCFQRIIEDELCCHSNEETKVDSSYEYFAVMGYDKNNASLKRINLYCRITGKNGYVYEDRDFFNIE